VDLLSSGPLTDPCLEYRRLRLRPVLFEPASEPLACSSSRLGSEPLFGTTVRRDRLDYLSVSNHHPSHCCCLYDVLLGDRLVSVDASPRVAHGAPLALLPLTAPRGLHQGIGREKSDSDPIRCGIHCAIAVPDVSTREYHERPATQAKLGPVRCKLGPVRCVIHGLSSATFTRPSP
jgi:hypothetical protein